MVIESSVLNGNKCICKVLRNFIHRNIGTVGVFRNQFGHFMTFGVVYHGSIAFRGNVQGGDVRGR